MLRASQEAAPRPKGRIRIRAADSIWPVFAFLSCPWHMHASAEHRAAQKLTILRPQDSAYHGLRRWSTRLRISYVLMPMLATWQQGRAWHRCRYDFSAVCGV